MTVSLSNLYLRICIIMLIISSLHVGANAQVELSGNFSTKYSSTGVVNISSDRVRVNDISGFSEKDTVLIIQMQGVGITTGNNASFGNNQIEFGRPGFHEFIIIDKIITPDEIVFRSNLSNPYDAASKVQLIKVPYFNSVNVSGTLTVDPWNSSAGKGGVIVFIVGRSLVLNADIDVSGKGFKGGDASIGSGECGFLDFYYPFSFNGAGFKGEGLAIHDEFKGLLYPGYVRGRSSSYNSGGGGNGRFSGGGGGGHRGIGGKGGIEEEPFCLPLNNSGIGGKKVVEREIDGRIIDGIFFGGGGGASTSLSGTLGA